MSEEVQVMYGEIARVGDRVRHYGQRYGNNGTATVKGFQNVEEFGPWYKVLIEPDDQSDPYFREQGWDWDRTVLVESRKVLEPSTD